MTQKAETVNSAESVAEAERLEKKIEEGYQDLQEQDRFKKDKIKNMANWYKRLIELGRKDIEPREIAREMIKEIQARGIDISPASVYLCVPDDCKGESVTSLRPEEAYNNIPDSNVGNANPHIDVEKLRGADNAVVDEAHTELAEAEKDLQAKLRLIRDQKEKVEEIGQERKLTFSSHQKNEQKTTPTPDALEQATYADKLEELGYALIDFAHKVRKFTTSKQDDAKFAKSVQPYIDEFRFLTDEKFTKGERGWLETIKTKEVGFKHEAGSIHKSLGKFKVKKWDDKGEEYEEWVELPREVTREQIGDRADILIDYALNKINAEFLCEAAENFHDKFMEPFIAGRKINLHDTLSEKA